jgi:pimeloyl-ACP methyl ester carboxylesterase
VFVVGHDWGAIIAWYLCLFRPDRVTALVNTSVAFMRHVFVRAGAAADAVKATDYFNRTYGPTYYICRFQVRTYVRTCSSTVVLAYYTHCTHHACMHFYPTT